MWMRRWRASGILFVALILSGSLPNSTEGQQVNSSPRRVKVIAHRGASAYAPENTLAAFKKAIALHADILELDVHQTKDLRLVVIHDATVDRTTNGKGRVKDLTLKELHQLDAGSWFSPAFTGEHIPLLDEVLDLASDSVSLLIELKEGSDEYPNIEERIIQLVREKGVAQRVIFKSFLDETLDRLRQIAPDIPRLKIVFLQIPFLKVSIGRGLDFGSILDDSVQYLQHHWFGLTESFITEAHSKGYRVFAWDVNDMDRMKDLILRGIDGIETDYPDILSKLVHAP
jgi:glycerophosphoryl diester phosphodiesterase